MMRKLITAFSIAAVTAAALATPAMARMDDRYPTTTYIAPVAGAAAGTVVGVGLYNGWFGAAPAISGAALPTTAAGAAVTGGVVGVGAIALIDSVVQPCRGFHALFGANKGACVNGEYVGYPAPRRVR